MPKQILILLLVLCSSIALLTAHALPQTLSSNQSARTYDDAARRRMTDAERRKEAAERRRQLELREKELAKEERKPRIDRAQQIKEFQERAAKVRKEFLHEKSALQATEEQWNIIKAKLEEVRYFRNQARSTVRIGLTSSSSSGTKSDSSARRNVPTWQWTEPWKDKDPSELTDAQKLANQLITLVENNNTTSEQLRRKMDDLRKAKKEEDQIERKLAEAQKELRELLTPRQEAALVLMNWL
jgi:hypothetical protein